MEEIIKILPVLIPLLILQLGLMTFALVELYKASKVKFFNKTIWTVIIICVQMIGPIVYLVVGRSEE